MVTTVRGCLLLIDLVIHIWFPSVFIVQMDEIEIQQHYDEFFEEIYVEMEKVI